MFHETNGAFILVSMNIRTVVQGYFIAIRYVCTLPE